MANEWHWQRKPRLDTCRYKTLYQRRPQGVTEIGEIDVTDSKGNIRKAKRRRIRLRSVKSTKTVYKTFVNHCQTSIRLLWIDFYGDEVAYQSSEPEGEIDMMTFMTHPWIARRNTDRQRVLINGSEVYLPTMEHEQRIYITEPPLLKWTIDRHIFFSAEFKTVVKTLLLCHHHTHRSKAEQNSERSDRLLNLSTERYKSLTQRLQNVAKRPFLKSRKKTKASFSDLPCHVVVKIVDCLSEFHPTEQTLLKGTKAAPDIPLIDFTCLPEQPTLRTN